jgi:hypothetical protein
MAETTIPVTVAEDAAARVAGLGLQREFGQMIEHAKQTAPGLRAIRVTLEYDPACPHNDPGVVIWVHRDEPADKHALGRTDQDWGEWEVATFSPQVLLNIVMISVYGGPDEW